jgi:formylmethanofuran dehydrogenase subunit C
MKNLKKELLKEVLGDFKKKEVNLEKLRTEKSLSELKDIVSQYFDLELKGEFQLKPDKAFEFGRKMRSEHSLSLRDVERLVNNTVYEVFEEKIGDIKTKLCHQFYDNYLGYFVSGLYHDIIGDRTLKIEIKIPRFVMISRIGFRWGFGYKHPGGKLVISGYAGGYLGEAMRGGIITVTGFTGDYVGKDMRGGRIVLKGNAGWRLGDSMRGGKIVVIGNAGEFVGINMRAGLIRIKGEVLSIGRREGGKIEIWKNGKWTEVEG